MKIIQLIKEHKRKIIIGIFWLIIIAGGVFILIPRDRFICPEDYQDQDKYIMDMGQYFALLRRANPEITTEEMYQVRYNDLKKYNCQKALELWAKADLQEANKKKSGTQVDIPSIGADKDYGKDFKIFKGDLFSFKYPDYLTVISDSDFSGTIIVPKEYETKTGYPFIVITPEDNTDGLTTEEWLLGSDSNYNYSSPYYKTKIDDQEAVYADGGMIIVVNTPDDKHRLVIVDKPSHDGTRLFTEMGIVFESLVFKY